MRSALLASLPGALCLFGTTGCLDSVSTMVRLRDPHAVELRTADRTVIPAGSEPVEAQLAARSVATGVRQRLRHRGPA